jgi:hypothetical protein
MQEPHVEEVANHNDPESCGVCREVRVEALTGGSAGQPLSFEIHLRGADRVVLTGRHYWESHYRDGDCNPCGVRDPGMRGHFWRGNREIFDAC